MGDIIKLVSMGPSSTAGPEADQQEQGADFPSGASLEILHVAKALV
jgi:hypothetical protein